ncbi:MAG: hypothetical protein HYT16_01125 [DPANN group archaeon]|nr:hypothetical protein [DPANN group archaeon]
MADERQAGSTATYAPRKSDDGSFFLEVKVGNDIFKYLGSGLINAFSDLVVELPQGVSQEDLDAHYAPIRALEKYGLLARLIDATDVDALASKIKAINELPGPRKSRRIDINYYSEVQKKVKDIRALPEPADLEKKTAAAMLALQNAETGFADLAAGRVELAEQMRKAREGVSRVISATEEYQEQLQQASQRVVTYASVADVAAQTAERVKTQLAGLEAELGQHAESAKTLKGQRADLEASLGRLTTKVGNAEEAAGQLATKIDELTTYADGQQASLVEKSAELSDTFNRFEAELRGFAERKTALEQMYQKAEEVQGLLGRLQEFDDNLTVKEGEAKSAFDGYRVIVDEYLETVKGLQEQAQVRFDGLSAALQTLSDKIEAAERSAAASGADLADINSGITEQAALLQTAREKLEQARPAYEAAVGLWGEVAEARAELKKVREAAGVAPVRRKAEVRL